MIATEMIAKGSPTEVTVPFKTILRRVLMNNAEAFILAHNHPSENAWPSIADIEFTVYLRSRSKMLDLKMIDHIILSEKEFYSFTEERTHKFRSKARNAQQ